MTIKDFFESFGDYQYGENDFKISLYDKNEKVLIEVDEDEDEENIEIDDVISLYGNYTILKWFFDSYEDEFEIYLKEIL